ncbi:hypothetical protein BaRGS_00010269 [Batillaria attramentaria]|uniref:Secreted protein n=1 Tax=Batillaria attramentaria TaxID=370345 RepID=A0ABD0LHZ9_9CAEN
MVGPHLRSVQSVATTTSLRHPHRHQSAIITWSCGCRPSICLHVFVRTGFCVASTPFVKFLLVLALHNIGSGSLENWLYSVQPVANTSFPNRCRYSPYVLQTEVIHTFTRRSSVNSVEAVLERYT